MIDEKESYPLMLQIVFDFTDKKIKKEFKTSKDYIYLK